jgi:UDP-N-acetylmuramoylalanine--D-glutamate ligase
MQKKALVIGFGSSGKAVFGLLEKKGYDVFIYDDSGSFSHSKQISLEDLDTTTLDMSILSPGISIEHPVCVKLLQKEVPIQGEACFALSLLPQRKIGVTGTNGKTTVTYLCEHILNYAGYKAQACGNVSKDKPLSLFVDALAHDVILVVELSSYQLETLHNISFESGIILNITPDHLDRYLDMEAYAEAKCRLLGLCKKSYVFQQVQQDFPNLVADTSLIYSLDDKEGFLDIKFDSYLDQVNAKSAFLLLEPFQIPQEVFVEALQSFKKPKHRLEKVAQISGIEFINDSKATNIDATIWALKSCQRPVILLAGGVDKGHPYTAWIPFLKNVKQVICFGQAGDLIYKQLQNFVDCHKKQTLAEAVCYAYDLATNGDIVLLSPGCSSFDAFKDYQDRGQKFCQSVLNLKPKEILL